ncbi:MAG: XRE family transcriptional regulator [Epsilonproteobacteria bacterium]|nr:MAG: XRE family transcriptional regulator [Campylobacterota bacterium]
MIYTEYTEKEIKDFYINIGQNVKKIRKRYKISQLDMAQMIGYKSASHFGKAEICSNNKHFNLEHLYRLSKALNIDVREFLAPIEDVKV